MHADLHTNMPYNNYIPSRVVYRFSGHAPRWWYITSFTRGTPTCHISQLCVPPATANVITCNTHHIIYSTHTDRCCCCANHQVPASHLQRMGCGCYVCHVHGRPMELPHTWLWQLHQDETPCTSTLASSHPARAVSKHHTSNSVPSNSRPQHSCRSSRCNMPFLQLQAHMLLPASHNDNPAAPRPQHSL